MKGFAFAFSVIAFSNAAIEADKKKWGAWLFWVITASFAAAVFFQEID